MQPASFICGAGVLGKGYGSEFVKGYISGWSFKSLNWVSSPDRYVAQMQALQMALMSQAVISGTPNDTLDLEFSSVTRSASGGQQPEVTAVEALVEVVAINPQYEEYYAIGETTAKSQSSSFSSSTSAQFAASQALPFAFGGISHFSVLVSDSPSSGVANGLNLQTLSVLAPVYETSLGNVQIDQACTLEGPSRGGGRSIECDTSVVLVFGEPTFVVRPANQPEDVFSEQVGIPSLIDFGLPPDRRFLGSSPCAMIGFGFEMTDFFKVNELMVMPVDCDTFYGGQAFVRMKVQGDDVAEAVLPSQEQWAACPPPSGVAYTCAQAKPQYTGFAMFDTAILVQ